MTQPVPTFFDQQGRALSEQELGERFATEGVRVDANAQVSLVQDVDGQQRRIVVPASEAQGLIAGGQWSLQAPSATIEQEARNEAGSLGGMATTALEGTVSGVTLGTSRLLANELLGDEYAAAQARRADVNPGTRIASEITGAIAPILASGGAGSVGAIARATPAGLVARGAAAAGEAAGARLGAGVLAKATEFGVAGALEGGAQQAGSVVSEAALGDEELTAEKVLAGFGEGAMLGAPFGAALGAGTKLVGIGAKKLAGKIGGRISGGTDDAGRLAAVAADEPQSGLLKGMARKFADASAPVSGKNADDIYRGLTSREARANWRNRSALKDDARTRVSRSLNDLHANEALEKSIAAGELKAKNLDRTVRRGEDVQAAARGRLETMSARVAQATEELDGILTKGDARRLNNIVRRAETSFDAAASSSSKEAGMYRALDDAKRELQSVRSKARLASKNSDPDIAERGELMLNATDELAKDLKSHLEDSAVWGEAATNQAQRNAVLSELIDAREQAATLFMRGKRGAKEVNDVAIDSYLSKLTDPRRSADHQSMIRYLEARKQTLETLERLGEVPDGLASQFAKAKEQAIAARAEIDDFGKRLGDANMIDELVRQDETLAGSVNPLTSLLGGAALGVPGLGAAVGAASTALGVASRPGQLVKQLAAVESLSQRVTTVDRSIKSAIGKFVKDSTSGATKKVVPRASRQKLTPAVTGAIFGKTQAERKRSFKKRSRQIQQLIDSPELMVATGAKLTSGMSELTPRTAQAVMQSHLQKVNYLASKLPRPPASIVHPKRRSEWEPSPMQISEFERVYRAVDDPRTVIDDMRRGTLTLDAVNAVRETSPRLWDEMRNIAMLEVANAPDTLSYSSTVQLSILFDFPGDATLTPAFLRRNSERWAAREEQGPPPQQPQGSPAPKVAESSMNEADQIVANL